MIKYSHPVFPARDIEKTASYYVSVLGFRRVDYSECSEPHVCLYRDDIEIILTKANRSVIPNHELYGYGYDAYLITENQIEMQDEFKKRGAKIVREVSTTDYRNTEFVVEDIDGRWLGFGVKNR